MNMIDRTIHTFTRSVSRIRVTDNENVSPEKPNQSGAIAHWKTYIHINTQHVHTDSLHSIFMVIFILCVK